MCQLLRACLRRASECVAGVAAIEFAIIAPVLVLAVLCTVDLGLAIYRKMQVENAARAGAEYALLNGFSTTVISSAVMQATGLSGINASPAPTQFCGCASNSGISTIDCSSTCAGGIAPGTYVSVSAQATYTTIVPYPVIANSFTFTAQSTMRLQ